MRLDPIIIRPYDASWPARFETQRQRISPALRPWRTRAVEHIGSTAVPGLSAKAIVDMLAVVSDTEAARDAIEPLAQLGWHHAPEPEDDAERHLSFCFPSAARRTHHLHVVEAASPDGSAGWRFATRSAGIPCWRTSTPTSRASLLPSSATTRTTGLPTASARPSSSPV